ncbi:MAG: ATP-dependent DNA helicase [Candidatus Nanoarchaeia archaeon]|nr:ATP-dependent DNA helicase [Candidatus Nanoarchaeia archaeon]
MEKIFFPFESVRNQQSDMVEKIYSAVSGSSHAIIHAPTGIGKTAGAISPALTYALKNDVSVLFLTPKHTQHKIAVETLKRIKLKHNLDFTGVDLIGKQWICPIEGIEGLSSGDFAAYCNDLKKDERCSYYNNIRKEGKITDKAKRILGDLKRNSPLHVEDVKKICAGCDMCAYEMSMNLAKEAKVIIGDYFHIFNKGVRSSLLAKMNKELSKFIVIVDEAHNLPDRIRELHTSKTTTYALRSCIKEARTHSYEDIAEDIGWINESLERLKYAKLKNKNDDFVKREEFIEDIKKKTGREVVELIDDFEEIASEVRKKEKRSWIGGLANFLTHWNEKDEEGYIRLIRKKPSKIGGENAEIEIRCLDPSTEAKKVIEEAHSVILMSGTLTPTNMYKKLLGFPDNTSEAVLSSPFSRSNRLVLIVPETTTKYSKRNDVQFKKIADNCIRMINASKVNTAIFFPSYNIMQTVYPLVQSAVERPIVKEKQNLTKEEKASLFEEFSALSKHNPILFGVMGANFSEGIDFPGKLLESIIIVGLPLGVPTIETKALIDYYEHKFGRGWDYGYIYPAMNRVLQASGRAIRSKTDRGVISLMDERYSWQNYLKCIPPEWQMKTTKEPEKHIIEFLNSESQV